MSTLASGQNVTFTLDGDSYFTITTTGGVEGNFTVAPLSNGTVKSSQNAAAFGPPAVAGKQYGPFGCPVTITLTSVTGSITYVTSPSGVAAQILGGTINGTQIGTTTPNIGRFTQLQSGVLTDISGTPGNGTSSGVRGRAAFAAAASTIVITSTQVTASSSIFVQLESADATLTTILSVVPAAGSFTVTGNAAATATTKFSFLVIN